MFSVHFFHYIFCLLLLVITTISTCFIFNFIAHIPANRTKQVPEVIFIKKTNKRIHSPLFVKLTHSQMHLVLQLVKKLSLPTSVLKIKSVRQQKVEGFFISYSLFYTLYIASGEIYNQPSNISFSNKTIKDKAIKDASTDKLYQELRLENHHRGKPMKQLCVFYKFEPSNHHIFRAYFQKSEILTAARIIEFNTSKSYFLMSVMNR